MSNLSKTRDRLRIAVQKSGRLAEVSQDLLARCGLKFRQSRDKLFCFGESMPIDLLLVRDDDIPGLISQGVCDLGIVGRNVLAEQVLAAQASSQPVPARELRPLNTGRCRLSIALPQDVEYQAPQQLEGLRIATSYPALLGAWLAEHKVEAKIVVLSGSVEIAPRLGTADAICDLVSSGATLVANQLPADREIVLHSENGLLGMGPAPAHGEEDEDLINAGKQPVTIRAGASYFHHADSFAMMRGGHLDICVLGAFQVSRTGDLANWHTGAPGAIPAVGGAMDLAIGARHVYVMMELLTREGQSKIVERCTYPLTGVACVERIYTDLATLDIGDHGVIVRDLADGLAFEELQRMTGIALLRAVAE